MTAAAAFWVFAFSAVQVSEAVEAHVYNDKLSGLRRKLYHDLKEKQQKQVVKGTRWLLLKNPENL